MMNDFQPLKPGHINHKPMVFFTFVAITLLCIKLVLIVKYGNATPYWDQWDAEADRLYRPWLLGELQFGDLFAPHNEHRIFMTRLLGLFLLEVNGGLWNPVLQMVVNSTLHILSLIILLFLCTKVLSNRDTPLFLAFALIVLSIPAGWANTLAGFQSQFYFLLLFSFIFIWCMSTYKNGSLYWWLGLFSGCLATLSLASGALTLFAGVFVLILKMIIERKFTTPKIASIVLILTIAGISIALTPTIPGHAVLKAADPYSFFAALAGALSWPEQKVGFGLFIVHLPLAIFSIKVLIDKTFQTPGHYFILGVGAWVFGQCITIAYGRSGGFASSRYLDIYMIGLVIGCASLLILSKAGSNSIGNRFLSSLWLGTIVYGFAHSEAAIVNQLELKAYGSAVQEVNVKGYLLTGDRRYLFDKPTQSIPYPTAERLQGLLDDPDIRIFLPRNIYVPGTAYDEKAAEVSN